MKTEDLHILIAGGSGFIGSYLKKRFEELGATVQIISRSGKDIGWSREELLNALENQDILINLAGQSINSRFTKNNKKEILRSRIETTALLNEVILTLENPPVLWINASASAIYKESFEEQVHDEHSTDFADDFLGNVVQQWEYEFFRKRTASTRKVAVRTSVVLGNGGGAFSRFRMLTRLGLGGFQGSGKQMISWIHLEDYFRAVHFIIHNENIQGVVNLSAPKPLSNRDFMCALRKSLKMLFGVPAPKWILRPTLKIIGIDASLVLNSSNFVSAVLKEEGFQFEYETAAEAFNHLTGKRG